MWWIDEEVDVDSLLLGESDVNVVSPVKYDTSVSSCFRSLFCLFSKAFSAEAIVRRKTGNLEVSLGIILTFS